MSHATPTWLPGLELCRVFYQEAVRPLLDAAYPGLTYAAARLGPGSDVLGLDTRRSVDHDWGPRLTVFLPPAERAEHADAIHRLLADRLPGQIRGWSTHFEPPDAVIRTLAPAPARGPIAHRVELVELGEWLTGLLGFDARAGDPTVLDWLATPAQRLLEVTSGAVYHDGTGQLEAVRDRLARYPDQVRRYLLAAQWERVHEEEPFVGRAAEAGDDLGSRVVTARLARDLMRLCLLLADRYPPYSKWLGAAFAAVPQAGPVAGALRAALAADRAADRETALASALRETAVLHNASGLTAPLDPSCRPFHDRPYPVLDAGRFAAALRRTLTDPTLSRLPPWGGVDQFGDSTALLTRSAVAHRATRAVLGGLTGTDGG